MLTAAFVWSVVVKWLMLKMSPSDSFLEGCTKEQIADHYNIDISDKKLKDTVKSILKANLYDMNVLPGGLTAAGIVDSTAFSHYIKVTVCLLNSRRNYCCCKWDMRS